MIKEPVIDELVARKFLLGQLSPEEQGQIEELAFEDPDTFALLESVEEDLVDEFLQGELSPFETQRFNDHFLSSPGRRQQLKISEVLQEHFNPPKRDEVITDTREEANDHEPNYSVLGGFLDLLTVQSFWARTITAAVLVALLLFIVWLYRSRETRPDPIQAGPSTPVNVPSPEPQISPSLHPSPSPVQADNKRRSPTPEKQKRSALPPEKPTPVATFANLMPSAVTRSGGVQQLQLPPDASSIRLGLVLPDRRIFRTYDAALHDEAGKELDHWHNRTVQNLPATQDLPANKGLVIDVRTTLLKPDESYRIVVTGVSSKGERINLHGYSFEAKK